MGVAFFWVLKRDPNLENYLHGDSRKGETVRPERLGYGTPKQEATNMASIDVRDTLDSKLCITKTLPSPATL